MKRALISVYDKSGLIPFIMSLRQKNYQIIATGGTYDHLVQAGIPCRNIDEVTGFPAIFGGRVKTLHPRIHGGLLGKRDHETQIHEAIDHQIDWIDLLVVNLYPFTFTRDQSDATADEIIEMIDIGGAAMIRSAAKNYRFVTVVTAVTDYDTIIGNMDDEGNTSLDCRHSLARKAFQLTASYDAEIATYLTNEPYPERITMTYQRKQLLRYGENPHQTACFYTSSQDRPYAMSSSRQLHGKDLSYNNIQDAEAALNILKAFKGHTAVVVKHMNPCGIGCAADIHEAFLKAYQGDPISIFGGIVGFSDPVDLHLAKTCGDLFLEVILAPDYTKDALEHLKQKKNLRIITFQAGQPCDDKEFRSVSGGLLIQDEDRKLYADITCPTIVKPTDQDMEELLFAFQAVKYVKSNAIVVSKNFQTIGIGAGQMSRVKAAKIALDQAGDLARGAYMASDAFIPMKDTVELAIQKGIKAIIQPGGSIKDQESRDLCDQHGIAMVMTSMRHFRHSS